MAINKNLKVTFPFDGKKTSGAHIPLWFNAEEKPIQFSTLNSDIDADVVIIGGGISGITAAYCMSEAGYKVVLLEDGFIGSGESGRTTCHLTCALDDRYFELEKIFDQETAKLAAESHTAAIHWIAEVIRLNKIDCDFQFVDGYLFLSADDNKDLLEKELNATHAAGLKTELIENTPDLLLQGETAALKFPQQAQFHILKYLRHLADIVIARGGQIFTETRADSIEKNKVVAGGFTISAAHIIVATNSPINDWVKMHTKQWPYRTYVIASKIPKGSITNALWWDTGDNNNSGNSEPYHYIRTSPCDHEFDWLIIGGEDHKTGQVKENELEELRYLNLEKWARLHFPAFKNVDYTWSGQVLEPIDALAYLGKNPGDDNIYIITGDSGNGMTHGTLGALIIRDIITGKNNPWIKIYDPARITMKKSGTYLREVGNMMVQYTDWLTTENIKVIDQLQKGEGKIVSHGINKYAVYKDENNEIQMCNGVCPHLGAVLHWNNDEKTFDCPMHGSRFSTAGILINGPAITDLKKLSAEEIEKLNS